VVPREAYSTFVLPREASQKPGGLVPKSIMSITVVAGQSTSSSFQAEYFLNLFFCRYISTLDFTKESRRDVVTFEEVVRTWLVYTSASWPASAVGEHPAYTFDASTNLYHQIQHDAIFISTPSPPGYQIAALSRTSKQSSIRGGAARTLARFIRSVPRHPHDVSCMIS
jgi:hypothetical protein